MTQRNGDATAHPHVPGHTDGPAYSTLPEVIPSFRDATALPEVRASQNDKFLIDPTVVADPKRDKPAAVSQTNLSPPHDAPEETAEQTGDSGTVATQRKSWYRRGRNPIILGVVAVVAILAVVAITLGVVLSKNKSPGSATGGSSTSTSSPTPDKPGTPAAAFGTPIAFPTPAAGETPLSTCQGTVCPQLLATAQFATPATTFLFALGSDSAIWVRAVSNGSWESEWTSLGGNFISQPAAASMRDGRVDVFGVWAEDKSVRFKTFQNGVWEKEYTNLGGRASTAVTVCSRARDNLHVLVLDGGSDVYQKHVDDGVNWLPAQFGKWEQLGSYASSTVDMACVNEGGVQRIDLVAYGRGKPGYSFTFKKWDNVTAEWSGWVNATGSLRGDPAIVSTPDRADLFGVAENGTLWTQSWIRATGAFTEGIDLGGDFQSASAAVATGSSRVDVVVVGTDAQVWHKARIDGVWGTDWDSLGGYFNSAPRIVMMDRQRGEAVIFGLGPNGTIIHTAVTVGSGYKWGARQWFSDGGSMSAKWFRLGPA
ncbi:hypothetical protein QBC47DRAFT_174829 [Echria macrotheca]|uniref:PLL-like beta propeller domain-containing protein n=1 Tax=Echria macrotheca TaxID=438768 RepID=A0AAJ0BF37_9PEZI|nr:hypothetical protein QBC47DRAFT_174829 [Echria macrotheca]